MSLTPQQLYDKLGSLGLLEAAIAGVFHDINFDGGANVQPQLHIKHMGNLTAYTVQEADDMAYMVFDHPGDLQVTLPLSWTATEDNPFSVMMVNTLGRIDFVIEDQDKFIGFAPHADKYVTVGLIRGEINWYATGTNNKLELS